MRSLTLLIQLFGREVMDRLAAAGYETGRSIVRAGADRLAQDGDIALPLARRIVAVATESEASAEEDASAEAAIGPDPPPRPASRTSGAGARSAGARRPAERNGAEKQAAEKQAAEKHPEAKPSAEKPAADRPAEAGAHVRRPLRRPSSPLASGRPLPGDAAPDEIDAALEAAAAAAEPADEPAPRARVAESPLDADPFVDDVGLIAWMGLNPRGAPSPPSFSVADGILDPPRRPPAKESPFMEEAPILQAPLAAEAPQATPVRQATPERQAAPAPLEAPAPQPAPTPQAAAARKQAKAMPPPATPARQALAAPRRPDVVSGSFWSFGRLSAATTSRPEPQTGSGSGPAGRAGGPAGPRPGLPRRRAHDE